MARSGYVGVTMPKEVQDVLIECGLVSKDEKSFSAWIYDTLYQIANKQKFLLDFAPRLSLAGMSNDSIIIKDQTAKEIRFAEITLKNTNLHCSLDDTDCCSHIHYALVLPDLGKIIKTKSGGK